LRNGVGWSWRLESRKMAGLLLGVDLELLLLTRIA
jgi:hypothetical protein